MRNYFPKRPSGAPLHTLSKLYDVLVGFVRPPPPYFEAEYCLFCGHRRVAVARYDLSCSFSEKLTRLLNTQIRSCGIGVLSLVIRYEYGWYNIFCTNVPSIPSSDKIRSFRGNCAENTE